MKRGDLVRVKFSIARIPYHPLAIILCEEHHAIDTRFFRVILPDGNTKLFPGNSLEPVGDE